MGKSQSRELDGQVEVAVSQSLNIKIDQLLDRITDKYKQQADYSEISRCSQKEGESFEDYRVRMTKTFKTHSGIPENHDDTGPYRQQLKNAIHQGSLPGIKSWVNKHFIAYPTSSLDAYTTYAMHAEKVLKDKKPKKAQAKDTFYQDTPDSEEDTGIFYQQQQFNRGHKRGRGRGQQRGRGAYGRNHYGTRLCYTCGHPGHLSRDCPQPHVQRQKHSHPPPHPAAPGPQGHYSA